MKLFYKIIKALLLFIGIMIIVVSLFFGHKDIPLEELKSKYAQAPSQFVDIEGMQVHFRDEGDQMTDMPIVLIHGTGASLHTFDEWAERLKREHRVIRMDLPGFGLTGPFPDRNYSMENYVDFIKEFLESRGVGTCILGGNSLGGAIAWQFTAKNPEMVEKLILIDAAGYPMKSESRPIAFTLARIPVVNKALTFITPLSMVRSSVENVYADKSKVSDQLVERYFKLTLRTGNRQALVDRMAMETDMSKTGLIKNINQATLVLWGDEDLLIPVANAYLFHKDLPNSELVILKNSGHVPMEESPEESLEALFEFLGVTP
ncbi:alpha/beta fold hydrolase [Lutimonas zeaxanthinifaciens]|uniref:alpha/beta fold hydrolase n=1 Tax=Lutimonas zeaxanthinifaciens TaxID=3060215 RepID=UPI00265D5B13|nr:alpha/beta hydrolase [Lutimonas sp. YSD2104]WKK67543.1 alpha/beta hydrolase [Lutimonas sp. YSD2104]